MINNNELTNQIVTRNYESLTPHLDQTFKEFFNAVLSKNLDLGAIDKELLPPLEALGIEYLREHSDFETTRKYLKNLRIVWIFLIQLKGLEEARWYIERTLAPILQLEAATGVKIHKGPMYYFWGGTSLLLGRIDEGFLLMHAAYDEELRIGESQPTPSYKFVSLNFADKNHRFFPLVDMYADYLEQFIVPYYGVKASHLKLEDFRVRFLESNPSPDIVFSFTHTLARLHQLSRYPTYSLHSGFSSQHVLNLLFDLVLVIENALRIKHPNYGREKLFFPVLAEYLATSLAWQINRGHFTGLIQQKAESDYDQCLLDLLDKCFSFSHTVSNIDLECDLAIAYLIRNRGAHNVTASKVIALRFPDVLQSLMNVLFMMVEQFYI